MLVALTVSTEAAIAMAIIQIIYQQLENYVVYPIVYRRAVELSPFTTIVAGADRKLDPRHARRDPRRPVRRDHQDRLARGVAASARAHGGTACEQRLTLPSLLAGLDPLDAHFDPQRVVRPPLDHRDARRRRFVCLDENAMSRIRMMLDQPESIQNERQHFTRFGR